MQYKLNNVTIKCKCLYCKLERISDLFLEYNFIPLKKKRKCELKILYFINNYETLRRHPCKWSRSAPNRLQLSVFISLFWALNWRTGQFG